MTAGPFRSVLGSAELRSIIMITLHNTLTKSVDIDLFITAQNYRQFHAKGGSSLFNIHETTIFFIEFNLGPGLGNKGVKMLTSDIQISRLWDS